MIASSPSAAQMGLMPTFVVVALTRLYSYFLQLVSMQTALSYHTSKLGSIFG